MHLIFQQILLTQKRVGHFAAGSLRKSHFVKASFKQQSLSALLVQIQYLVHFFFFKPTQKISFEGWGGQVKTVRSAVLNLGGAPLKDPFWNILIKNEI